MYRKKIKRVLDILFSVVGIILLSPFLLLLSAAVLVLSGSPVIFRQDRLGLGAKVFSMYKFRTMVPGAEEQPGGVYSDRNDPRLTGIGKILRATSLDELPQLFNILRGDMSFIGPRPPLTYHPWKLEEYSKEQMRMFEVRPGITGWAQVQGRKQVEWNKRIRMNIWYVDHLSFALDCRILFMTVRTVLSGTGNENSRPTV